MVRLLPFPENLLILNIKGSTKSVGETKSIFSKLSIPLIQNVEGKYSEKKPSSTTALINSVDFIVLLSPVLLEKR